MMRVKEPILSKKADEVNRQFLLLKRECEEYRVLESVSHLAIKLMNLLAEMERFFEKSSESDKRDQVLELYFKVREFLNIHDILDENYVIYSEYQQDGRFMVKLFCVNPAVNLQAYLEYGIGTVFFRQRFFRSVIIKSFYRLKQMIMRSMRILRFRKTVGCF